MKKFLQKIKRKIFPPPVIFTVYEGEKKLVDNKSSDLRLDLKISNRGGIRWTVVKGDDTIVVAGSGDSKNNLEVSFN